MVRFALLLAAGLGVLAPRSIAEAQGDPQVAIAQIREHVLYARYDEAVAQAEALLERDDLSAGARNQALEVMATAYLANRDMDRANPVLERLYARDPRHRLTDADASPLVQGAFQRARENAPSQVEVRLDHTPPTVERREAPLIEVRVTEGADAVSELQVHYRTIDSPRFARLALTPDGGVARGRIPLVGPTDQEQRIEYFISALAPSGYRLAGLGSEDQPLELVAPAAAPHEPESPSPQPLAPEPGGEEAQESRSLWWVGLLVGVVAVGAGLGAYFALRPEAPEGSLGQVSLELR